MSTHHPQGTLAALLDVDAVMARYSIRDRRAARRLMDGAGGFQVAGRLLVSTTDLAAHEQRLANQRRSQTTDPAPRTRRTTRRGTATATAEALSLDWWLRDQTATAGRTPAG